MGSQVKITLIGAGSGQFSLGIVRDLCLTEGLRGSTVSFMDINKERLDAVRVVATKFASEVGMDLEFESTLDRRAALKDADFVINSAMVIGWDKRRPTLELCRKHGYYRGVNVGSYYQFKLFMDIIHDMEDVCPNAWYIQSANPVFDGTTLISRLSKIKAVGLCHGQSAALHIAKTIGLDPAKVEYQCYGINHFIWLTKFTCDGKDAYPALNDWIAKRAEDYWASPECDISADLGPKAVDVYRRVGLFPIGDTVTPGGGSSLSYYHADKETEVKWKEDPDFWFDRHIDRVGNKVDDIIKVAYDADVKATSVFPTTRTDESNVAIINAIANDQPRIFQVNILNRGSVPGVADDVAVDIPGLVSAAGIQGLVLDPLPPAIACLMQEKIINMERGLAAYLNRDKNLLLEMVLANPFTRTVDQAKAVLDDLLDLPWNAGLKDYYR